jgi:hypothetical protein
MEPAGRSAASAASRKARFSSPSTRKLKLSSFGRELTRGTQPPLTPVPIRAKCAYNEARTSTTHEAVRVRDRKPQQLDQNPILAFASNLLPNLS